MKQWKWLICLYPAAWRKRYEKEFIAMLEQYGSPRISDIFDIVAGAIDAHMQMKDRKKSHLQPSLSKGGFEHMPNKGPLMDSDKAFAQQTFVDCMNRYQLPIVFHDVAIAPCFVNQEDTLTFFFYADEKVDFKLFIKDLAGVFKQRIQLKQVGTMKWKHQAKNYIS